MSITIINQDLFNTYFRHDTCQLEYIFKVGINGIKINPKNKEKIDETSLKFLSNKELSQSQSIRLGNYIEKIFSNIIREITTLENIKPKNKKG